MKYMEGYFEKNAIFCHLNSIRKRPGLWLGEKSLTLLNCHIEGYIIGVCEGKDEEQHIYEWYRDFVKYICRTCPGGTECGGAVRSILECGYNEEEGVDYFFELLDSYLKENSVEPLREEETISYLKNEIRVIYLNEEEIRNIVGHYISENEAEFFDIPAEMVSTLIKPCMFTQWRLEDKGCICALLDKEFADWEDVQRQVKEKEVSVQQQSNEIW